MARTAYAARHHAIAYGLEVFRPIRPCRAEYYGGQCACLQARCTNGFVGCSCDRIQRAAFVRAIDVTTATAAPTDDAAIQTGDDGDGLGVARVHAENVALA